MKKYLAVLLAVLLLLGGCMPAPGTPETVPEPDAPETEQTPADNPVEMGLGIEAEAGFDPYSCRSSTNRLVLELVTQPLFTATRTGEAVPVLAKGWFVSGDGRTTVVYLREDVLFHDGTPLTAADVARSVELAREGSYYRGRFDCLQAVTVVDETTVAFITHIPCECFPLLLDIPVIAAGEFGFLGTGPYTWDGEQGLRRAETWKGEWPAAAQTIRFVPVTDAFSLRDGFQFGQISAAAVDPHAAGTLGYNGDYELWSIPTSVMQYIGFNLERGVFRDGGLRSAVTYAVDREAVVREDMNGFGVAAGLAALPGSRAESEELAQRCEYAPEKLKNLVTPGTEITMIVSEPGSQRAATAQRIADSLEDCGFRVDLQVLSSQAFLQAMEDGAFDLYYTQVRLSPDMDLSPFFRTGGSLGYGGLDGHEDIAALCDLARANSGNSYDLQKAIFTDGLLCPVAFNQTALYLQRDCYFSVEPYLGGWYFLHTGENAG